MTTTQHTPGPWAVQQQGLDEPQFIIGAEPENSVIALIVEGNAADWQLIAAAPELLEALEAVLATNEIGPAAYELADAAYRARKIGWAAIAKAKGGAA